MTRRSKQRPQKQTPGLGAGKEGARVRGGGVRCKAGEGPSEGVHVLRPDTAWLFRWLAGCKASGCAQRPTCEPFMWGRTDTVAVHLSFDGPGSRRPYASAKRSSGRAPMRNKPQPFSRCHASSLRPLFDSASSKSVTAGVNYTLKSPAWRSKRDGGHRGRSTCAPARGRRRAQHECRCY